MLKKALVLGISGVIALALSAGAAVALPNVNTTPNVPDQAAKVHGHFQGDFKGIGQKGHGSKGKAWAGVWRQIPAMLGMDASQLKEQLKSGKALAQIAEDKGIAKTELIAKLKAAMESNIDQAVKEQKLTAEKAAEIKGKLPEKIEKMITKTQTCK